jgi:hypothetical protein
MTMRTVMKVGGCVLIPIVLLIVAVIGGGVYWWTQRGGSDLVGMGLTTSTFFQAAIADDWPTAHRQLSSTLQQEISAEALGAAWQRAIVANGELQPTRDTADQPPAEQIFAFGEIGNLTFADVGGVQTASVLTNITFATSGPQQVTLRYIKEGDTWRLDELPAFLTQP